MNFHINFFGIHTSLYSYQQHIRVPFPTHTTSPEFVVFCFLMLFIVTGVRCILSVVLTLFFFMAKDVECFFMYSHLYF
jgi:hypothetical protein